MTYQPELTDREWEIILQLLEEERRNLPPEIRRTDSPTIHDELNDRLREIDSLMERIRKAQVAVV